MFLYIRMVFLMIINLYTSRVVLQCLGVEEYGVYNAVGGFISMFSMISAALSTAISRFLTYTIGEGNISKLKKVFSTSVIIQILLCVILVLLMETVGVWFLNTKMTIPEGRYIAANWVFQFSLITFTVNLLSVPYNAVLIAHEKMNAFAYIGIYEGLAALGIAFFLKCSPIDTLIFYAFLMCSVALSTRLIYGIYCKRHFEECTFSWIFEKSLLKDMLGFAGWNFIGVTSGVLRSQGINLLFNVYLGPIINAARGLAMQVLAAVNKFSGSFYTAIQPQITKYYAAKEYDAANGLVCRSSRLAFFLLMCLCLPLLWETDFLLGLWLEEVPIQTSVLTRIVLVFTLSEAFSQPLIYLMLATGNIKKYQIVVGGLCLLNFPVAWVLLHLGYSAAVAQATTIIFSWFSLFARLYMLHGLVNFPVFAFLKETLVKSLLVFALSSILPVMLTVLFDISWKRFIFNAIAMELVAIIVVVSIGLSQSERRWIFSKIRIIKG